jgi:hypothetical protein
MAPVAHAPSGLQVCACAAVTGTQRLGTIIDGLAGIHPCIQQLSQGMQTLRMCRIPCWWHAGRGPDSHVAVQDLMHITTQGSTALHMYVH